MTIIAQAGDGGAQARPELLTLDARTLLPEMGAALFAEAANLGELGKCHEAWKRDIVEMFPQADPETVIPRLTSRAQHPEVGYALP